MATLLCVGGCFYHDPFFEVADDPIFLFLIVLIFIIAAYYWETSDGSIFSNATGKPKYPPFTPGNQFTSMELTTGIDELHSAHDTSEPTKNSSAWRVLTPLLIACIAIAFFFPGKSPTGPTPMANQLTHHTWVQPADFTLLTRVNLAHNNSLTPVPQKLLSQKTAPKAKRPLYPKTRWAFYGPFWGNTPVTMVDAAPHLR